MQVNLREFWNNYRTEVWFFVILCAVVALSIWLARFIPDDVFDNTITPILITSTVVTAFIGALLMYRRNAGIRAHKLFGWSLAIWGLCDLVYLIGWATAPKQVMDMSAFELTDYELLIGNILGWSMLLYPTEALRPGWLTWQTAIWQLLPMFALVALDYLVPLNISPIIACYPYVLLALLFTHMRAYRIWCEENYSTLDDIDVRWLIRYNCILFLVGINYVYICYSHGHTRGFTQQWLVAFMMMYSIDQILFRKNPWDTVKNEVVNVERMAVSDNREKLEHWMTTAKPYLNPNLQLMDLREVLPMNRTYLSRFLHDEFGCTFYQYVNRYRIGEAKRLMTEHPNMKMMDVAAQSGFASSVSFSRVFSQEIGVSPTVWNKTINNK